MVFSSFFQAPHHERAPTPADEWIADAFLGIEEDVSAMMKLVDTNNMATKMGASPLSWRDLAKQDSRDPPSSTVVSEVANSDNIVNNDDEIRDDNTIMLKEVENNTKRIGSYNDDNDKTRSCVVITASSSTSTILSNIELSLLPTNDNNVHAEESSVITTHPDLPVDMISPTWYAKQDPNQSFFDGGESFGSLTTYTDEGNLDEAVNVDNGQIMHVKKTEEMKEEDKGRDIKKEMKDRGREFKKLSTPCGSKTISTKNLFQIGIMKNKTKESKIAPTTTSKVVSEGSGSNKFQDKATPKISNISDNSGSGVAAYVADNNTNSISEPIIPPTACDVDYTFSNSTDELFANAKSIVCHNGGGDDAAILNQTNTNNDEEDCSVGTTFINDISMVSKVKMNEFGESINKLITVAMPAIDDSGDNTKALVGPSTNATDPLVPGALTPIQEIIDNDDVDVKLLPRDIFGRIKIDDREVIDVSTTCTNTTTIAAITSLVTILNLPTSANKMLARYKGREEELLLNLKMTLAKHLDGETAATIAKISSLIKELSLPKSTDEMLTEYKGREAELLKILKLIKDKQQQVQSPVTPVKAVVVEHGVPPSNHNETKNEKLKPTKPKTRRIKSNSMKKIFMRVGLSDNPSEGKVTGTAVVNRSKVADVRVSEETVKEDKTATIAHIIEYHELKNLSPVGAELANGEVEKVEDPIFNMLSVVSDKTSQPASVSLSKLFLYTDLDPLYQPAAKVALIKSVDNFSFIKSPRRNQSGTLRKESEGLEAAISLKDDDKTPKMGRTRTFDKPFSKRFLFDTVNSVNSAVESSKETPEPIITNSKETPEPITTNSKETPEPITKSERKKRKVDKKMMRHKQSKKLSSDRVEQPYPAISETYSSELYESFDSDDPLDYITDFFCCGDDTL